MSHAQHNNLIRLGLLAWVVIDFALMKCGICFCKCCMMRPCLDAHSQTSTSLSLFAGSSYYKVCLFFFHTETVPYVNTFSMGGKVLLAGLTVAWKAGPCWNGALRWPHPFMAAITTLDGIGCHLLPPIGHKKKSPTMGQHGKGTGCLLHVDQKCYLLHFEK